MAGRYPNPAQNAPPYPPHQPPRRSTSQQLPQQPMPSNVQHSAPQPHQYMHAPPPPNTNPLASQPPLHGTPMHHNAYQQQYAPPPQPHPHAHDPSAGQWQQPPPSQWQQQQPPPPPPQQYQSHPSYPQVAQQMPPPPHGHHSRPAVNGAPPPMQYRPAPPGAPHQHGAHGVPGAPQLQPPPPPPAQTASMGSMRPMRPAPPGGAPAPHSSMGGMRPAPPTTHMAQRPIPADIASATSGMQRMGFGGAPGAGAGVYGAQQHMGAMPQGVSVPPVTDPSFLPRPDLSGSAVAVRIVQGDVPLSPPSPDDSSAFDPQNRTTVTSSDPVACPKEIFIPASPRCVRLTAGAFPNSMTLAKKYGLPLGAIIQPLAKLAPGDEPVPVVNFLTTGIVRCRRCRSYVNFSCKFTNGGRHWVCSMCRFVNDVPTEYFSPLDERGHRKDAAMRPELHRGTIELVAPAEYMVRPPMPPVYLFVLEVTPAASNSSALAAMISGIKRSIDAMPDEGRTRVGVITFDSAVHFYTLRPGPDAEPSVSVVSDITDMFLPTPECLLASLHECRPAFEKALDMIAASYVRAADGAVHQSSASCLGAAVQGAKKALEFAGGKLVLFAASRPTAGPGALRDRGDQALLGTDRERAILRPDVSFYRQIAVEMSKMQIACDLFLCPPPPGLYLDLATISQMTKFTGGELFYAPSFDAPRDAPRLQLAVNRMLARETGFEAVMRIRATKSVRCTQFSGRFFTRSTDLLAMPGVDADKAYSVQFAFDESTLSDGPFCIQVALLYTTSSGERRLRVHTVAIPTTNSLAEMYMRTDTPAMGNIFSRMAAEGIKDRVLDEMRKNTMERIVIAFAKYREACQMHAPGASKPTQLLMPNAMSLLPLYIHGLGKTPLLSRATCGAYLYRFDDKAAMINSIDVMNVAETSAFLYPSVIPVFSLTAAPAAPVKYPAGAPASLSSLRPDVGAVIDDGRSIILWLGAEVIQPFTSELLGKQVTAAVDPRVLSVELLRRAGSVKGRVAQVAQTVTWLLQQRRAGAPFLVVYSGDQRLSARVEALMTEDRSSTSVSYKELLCEMQRQVSMKSSKR